MKLTKEQLKQIIKEELDIVLETQARDIQKSWVGILNDIHGAFGSDPSNSLPVLTSAVELQVAAAELPEMEVSKIMGSTYQIKSDDIDALDVIIKATSTWNANFKGDSPIQKISNPFPGALWLVFKRVINR